MIHTASQFGSEFTLLKSVLDINRERVEHFVDIIRQGLGDLEGKTIGVLGLAFKPNTDDMREAKSIEIIRKLLSAGAHLKVYDPAATENAKRMFPDITYCQSAYQTAEESDALVIVTEWREFKLLDMEKLRKLLKRPLIFDGRNIYDPGRMTAMGFVYHSIGRPTAAGAAIPAGKAIVDDTAARIGIKRREERHWGAFFLGLLIGAAIGAIVALLTTPKRGSEMRDDLGAILRAAGVTVLLVTHDREEAFSIADRIALMLEGSIVQAGTAEEVYYDPADPWAAAFGGAANLVPGRVENGVVDTLVGRFRVANGGKAARGSVRALIRPELLELLPDAGGTAEVVGREFRGHDVFYRVRIADGTTLVSHRPSTEVVPLGARVAVRPHEAEIPVYL